MERVIATHHHDGHQLDVVELVDDDDLTVRFVVDGQLLPADAHPGHVPTAEEARSLLATRSKGADSNRVAEHEAKHSVLSPQEVIALLDALDDQHRAHATYAQVVSDFGEVMPFANIVGSKSRHIESLTELMQRYEVPVPTDPWPTKVERYESVADACAEAAEAERASATLCSRLLAHAGRSEVRDVLHELEEASRQRHLPAFQRCVEQGQR
ncbi:MAG: hypothetical protein U5K29_05830 [Acidimicrobiales bacterium]|nr:hypothetical protein [Acidimicrobiales bacterium]